MLYKWSWSLVISLHRHSYIEAIHTTMSQRISDLHNMLYKWSWSLVIPVNYNTVQCVVIIHLIIILPQFNALSIFLYKHAQTSQLQIAYYIDCSTKKESLFSVYILFWQKGKNNNVVILLLWLNKSHNNCRLHTNFYNLLKPLQRKRGRESLFYLL